MDLNDYLRAIPDFPKKGILFRDITPLLGNPQAFEQAIVQLTALVQVKKPEAIVAIESRGFILAAPIAIELGIPFVPVRKPGKLPAKKLSVEYALEYGNGQLDIHQDAIAPGMRVAIIDDLLATGGTAAGAAGLVAACGGQVASYTFLIEILGLNGRSVLPNAPVASLLQYD